MAAKSKTIAHKWQFKARLRRQAFGWRSQPAITRVKEAVSEIKKVARKDKMLAAEGAVSFLEKVSPALEHVDSSSGAIGTAVNKAIAALVAIIASAPADEKTRQKWLERLFEAHAADQIPYIEGLADYWGELCASPEVASRWADELIGIPRMALSPDKNLRGHFHGTSACLTSLYAAGRYDDLLDLRANRARTYTAWFRAVAKKYPSKMPGELLEDLANETPGKEGTWFAAAKDATLFDEAIALANRTPCSPQTLTRAAESFGERFVTKVLGRQLGLSQ